MEQHSQLLPLESLRATAECLKALGHPMRLRMVEILLQGPFAVHEIAERCQLPPHQACEHLRLLKAHGLLDSRRRGRAVYYEVADLRLPRLMDCIRMACDPQPGPSAKTCEGELRREPRGAVEKHGDQ